MTRTFHPRNRYDRSGNRVLVERVWWPGTGLESPFDLREQNSPPPDVQAQEQDKKEQDKYAQD